MGSSSDQAPVRPPPVPGQLLISGWCTELSIPQVNLYMLSAENLKRPNLIGLVAVIDAFLVSSGGVRLRPVICHRQY